jgi:hypothetical protein
VELFDMKQEIAALQAGLDEAAVEGEKPAALQKMVGRGWRNTVMERRIYGRWD